MFDGQGGQVAAKVIDGQFWGVEEGWDEGVAESSAYQQLCQSAWIVLRCLIRGSMLMA